RLNPVESPTTSRPCSLTIPTAAYAVILVRACVIPAPAELGAVATHRDVFEVVGGKRRRPSRSEGYSRRKWLIGIVVADVSIRVQQPKPLKIDSGHTAGLGKLEHRRHRLPIVALRCVDHEQ